jgi:hypothetical protein
MHPLAKRIALLASGSCLVLGLILLADNLGLIPRETMWVALNLWPLALIIAGILLVADSLKKSRFTRISMTRTTDYPLPVSPDAHEILFRIYFSYGTLSIGDCEDVPKIRAEQIGAMGDPAVQSEIRGAVSVLTITMTQPIFPSHFQLLNSWHLDLPRGLPVRLELHLHEANLLMDLRRLTVESLDVKADVGTHEIRLGGQRKKLSGHIYSSSSDLSLVLPSRAYAQVLLRNPFCRVDYPQGDFERREDGSFVSSSAGDGRSSIEIEIDGPIRNLVLDVADSETSEA